MQSKILLFDFDGTIADTVEAAMKVYNDIAQENGYRLITQENFPILRNMGAFEAIRYMGLPMLKLPFIVSKARSKFKSEIPHLKIFKGIREPLRDLKSKGYKLYVISTNSTDNIRDFLARNHIAEFDGAYSVSNMFGKHVKIRRLIKTNKWDPPSVMYIGDEVRDIMAAKKAGISSVAVTWGYNTEQVLVKNNPDIIIRNPGQLASL